MIATALMTHDKQCNSLRATAFDLAIFLLLRDAMLYMVESDLCLRNCYDGKFGWREFGEEGTTSRKIPQHLQKFDTRPWALIRNSNHWAV